MYMYIQGYHSTLRIVHCVHMYLGVVLQYMHYVQSTWHCAGRPGSLNVHSNASVIPRPSKGRGREGALEGLRMRLFTCIINFIV